MAPNLSRFDDLFAKYEPVIRDAFLAAIDDVTSNAQVGVIISALERRDIEAAIEALHLDQPAFDGFQTAIANAYSEGGASTVSGLGALRDPQGARFVLRFDARNPRAETWLKSNSSNLVTRIIDEQKSSLRGALLEGLSAGRNPRSTALDIVGRLDKATGKRVGGLVGLSAVQERAVAKARQELSTGDYAAYLTRARRDKRFDKTIAAAAKAQKALTEEQIGKMIGRYSDSLLLLRGETIARTETLASLHESQDEAMQQLVSTGKVQANQIRRVWNATKDKRTRPDHAAAHGQSVGLNELFDIGGKPMRYPGDPAGGPENVINCRCAVVMRIDWLSNIR